MSKLKRLSVTFLSLIIASVILTMCSIVYSSGETMYFSIESLMHRNIPNLGYSIGNPNSGGHKIWNIVKRTGPSTEDILPGDYYCLKGGLGFANEGKNVTYDVFLDLKDEKNSIIAQNSVLADLLNGTIETDSGTVGRYEALLALFDLLYLPGSSEEGYKEELQQNVIQYASQYDANHSSYIGLLYEIPLTDDDIVAAQQAAIWYFTNYEDKTFDKTTNVGWLNFTTSENGSYTSFTSGYGEQGRSRGNGAEALYNYLIATAKENAKYYTAGDTSLPVSLSTSTLNYEESGDNYILGPIRFVENNKIGYNITLSINNGSSNISNYKLLDSSKKDVTNSKEIKDLVGEEFYISIPKSSVSSNVSNISLNFNTTYETTNTIVAAVSGTGGENEQPIGIPQKQEVSVPESLNVNIENKEFDLSLRKYITKVNNVELEGENSRVPNIDASNLNVGSTTASYKHKKDPVLVRIGDIVTYKITVYNEGEVAGYVNKIIDQLPRGLTYSKILTSGYSGSYDEENNVLTITRDSNNEGKLEAYSGGTLDSTTIEIECKVNTNEDGKVLTNIAYIEEEEKEDGTVITNQEGEDRDSVPSIKPVGNQDSIENYTGNGNKIDLTDKNYYYKGQEDDDDFEKLIVEEKTGSYNLQIEKVDSNDNSVKLENAEFSVNINNTPIGNLISEQNGLTSTETINITDVNTVDTIEITENKSPEGYNSLVNTITIRVEKEETATGYQVRSVDFVNNGNVTVDFQNNIIKVIVENEKKTGSYDLQLLKIDNETQSPLNGAEFEITLPDGSKETKTTEANGILEINNINIEKVGTDYITIEETSAPEGYNKLFNKIELVVIKQENTNGYVVSNVDFGENEGSGLGSGEVNLEYSSNLIKVIVPNTEKIGNYNLQLVKIDDENGNPLSGAEFKVTLPNGSEISKTTNENGILDLGKVEITEIGTDIIKIEELNAPSGYSEMFNKLEVEVTKEERGGAYIVAGVRFGNSEGTGVGGTKSATVDYQNNTVTVTVPNVKKEGNYNLQILKVDSENQSPLSGAEFKVTLPNGSVITNTTNENGILDLGKIDITEIGLDRITVEELNAPTGYNKVVNSFDLEVTKGEENGAYVVSDIKLNNAQGSGLAEGSLSVHREGSLITITVPNVKKEGSYNLQIEKVDSNNNSVKLEGAEFSVSVNNSAIGNAISGENGLTEIKTINIENLNNDIIEITESKAPEGYNSLIETIRLEVVKEETENGYSVSNINFSNNKNVTASLEGNTIKVVIKNRKKEFDLSLRKYITKVNGIELAGESSRVPNIDVSNLNVGSTTASYKHKKDPVLVRIGDIVTYKITVYNEGEVAGYVNKIIDQLPRRLTYSKILTSGYSGSYDEENNILTITRESNNDDKLEAYSGGTLDSTTIEIECKVNTNEDGKVLTNIAYIEEEEKEDGTVITNQEGEDRDSVPSTKPERDQDNISDYEGNENKEDLTDKNYYYKGQEDDDDFEKLIVEEKTGNYSLQIEKVDSNDNNVKLQGAEFSVKVNENTETITTGIDGLTTLKTIDIENLNNDTIEITENKAPEGYNSLIGTISLEVVKAETENGYSVSNINFSNNENVTASLEGNTIKVVVKNEKKAGNYNLQIEKVDSSDNNVKLEGAEFSVSVNDSVIGNVISGENGLTEIKTIDIENLNNDVIEITESKAPEGYNSLIGTISLEVVKEETENGYSVSNINFDNNENVTATLEGNTIKVVIENEKKSGNYNLQIEKVDSNDNIVKLEGAEFSVKINSNAETMTTGADGLTQTKTIDIENLNNDTIEITENKAPEGYNSLIGTITLEVVKSETENGYIVSNINFDNNENVTATLEGNTIKIVIENEKKRGNYNLQIEKVDSLDNNVKLEGGEFSVNVNNTPIGNVISGENGLTEIKTINIENLNNDIIEITESKAPEGYNSLIGTIRLEIVKSETENGYSVSNINFENTENVNVSLENGTIKVVVKNEKKEFDLSLRKYITKVNDTEYQREPQVDIKNLKDNVDTTAIYNHTKTPVSVKRNDLITYTIRVYNEGEVSGYANEVTDYLPEELEFVTDNEINKEYGWVVSSDGRKVTTDYLSKEKDVNGNNLIKEFNGENLDYRDLQIVCKVKDTAEGGKKLTNIAEISDDYNEYNIEDKDSKPEDLNYPTEEDLPQYKDDEINKEYVPGQEDDDDFEKVVVQEVTGNYKLQIEKVDSLDNNIKLQNAIFSVKVNGISIGNVTTGENGLTSLQTIDITDVNTLDTIEIEEISAPQGYNSLIGKITLEVVKEDVGTGYQAKEINFENTENVNASLENGTIKVIVKNEKKEFDLSLRKYITKVNGIELAGESSRVPNIDVSDLNVGSTTASYKHKKDPVLVRIGDTVTYKITVYNEGEVAGYVNKIVDQLPRGLTYSKILTSGYSGSYDEENNILTITRESNNDDKLEAYSGGTLDSTTIEIECKVNTNEDGKVLTNIAYIEEEGKEDGTVVTNQEGEDRDSVPSTKPERDQDNISDYEGNENKEDLTDKNYYYKGQEDDDDFEKLIVEEKTGNYSLQIEKVDSNDNNVKLQGAEFSVSVNNSVIGNVISREDGLTELVNIDITDVNSLDTIEITENKAPEGYNSLIGTITLEVTKVETETGYQVLNVNFPDNVSVSLDNGVIKVIVKNEEIKEFDMSLRKYITKVNDKEYERTPQVDVTNLIENTGTTAIYNHPKTPVTVEANDLITYTIRVYNEGEISGYANEVTDYLPEELEFVVDNEINKEYGWVVSSDGRKATTDYLSKEKDVNGSNLIKEFNGDNLDYRDLQIVCKVKETAEVGKNLTNLAEITKEVNENGEDVKDRDSDTNNIEYPTDEELPNYKDEETGDYIPGQEDDDDFEKVLIKEFDLALRKFITKVEDKDITNRIPEVSYDGEKITYNHTKEPVQLVSGNTVIYTIRVYNEGEIAGYAKEITDDIPEGLEFLPENETNVEYRWVMYDAEGNITEDVSKAVSVKTDYLSKEQEEEVGDNLLQAFDKEAGIGEENPDYRDVKIAFKVVEPNESDRVLVNSAQISDDSDEDGNEVTDKDSTPDEWIDGEDDQDREYVELLYFDLSLRKWVTQAIVIDKDGQTVTETGHQPYDDPEEIVKVELHRKHINDVTVKFRYKIRVTNEGEIAGYAKEVTDYVPEGLKFIAEDNPGWTDEGNNVISTRLLENTLLQPGEYAEVEVEVVLTWINDENNMGLKVNTTEISEDYNDYGVPDIDSTPDNKEEGEDDIDEAPVMLSVGTGSARTYFTLGLVVLVTIAGGIFVIKKYVL